MSDTPHTPLDLEDLIVQWSDLHFRVKYPKDGSPPYDRPILTEFLATEFAPAFGLNEDATELDKTLATINQREGLTVAKVKQLTQAAEDREEVVEPARPLIVTSWAECPPEREFLIPEWLPAGRVTLLTGKGGNGKSRLAVQLASSIAKGDPRWLPGGPSLRAADPQTAVVATWEDDKDDIGRHLHNIGGVSDLNGRLHGIDIASHGPLWARLHESPWELGVLTGTGRWLRAHCESAEARLLVIDPLAAAYAANENDRGEVRAFMSSWDSWARSSGCTVLMVAHPSKAWSEYSGSTDWYASARAFWTLGRVDEDGSDPASGPGVKKKDSPTATRLECVKTNYAAKPKEKHWLKGDTRWRAVPSFEAATKEQVHDGGGNDEHV